MTADVARYQPTTDIAPAPFSAGGNLIREAAAVIPDAPAPIRPAQTTIPAAPGMGLAGTAITPAE